MRLNTQPLLRIDSFNVGRKEHTIHVLCLSRLCLEVTKKFSKFHTGQVILVQFFFLGKACFFSVVVLGVLSTAEFNWG